MSTGKAWIKHLRKRRGRAIFQQALRMYRFHQTPFEKIIQNILDVLEKYGASFTFPMVASIATQKPDLLGRIISAKSEIAVHGFNHVKYPLITPEQQENDLKRAIQTFQRLGIRTNGFRAPYNAYDNFTPLIIEKKGFTWDAGIGYRIENRTKTDFFRLKEGERELDFACVPLNELSDDLMIDERNYSGDLILKLLKQRLDYVRTVHGLIMFDLHPIRIGQPKYVHILNDLIAYGTKMGGWFPTVTEALEIRNSKGNWGGFGFCCLLTGDVDNFYFRDYLKRLR